MSEKEHEHDWRTLHWGGAWREEYCHKDGCEAVRHTIGGEEVVTAEAYAAIVAERDAYHSVLRRVYCFTQTPEIERMIANVLGHHVNCAALEYSDQEQPCDCGGVEPK